MTADSTEDDVLRRTLSKPLKPNAKPKESTDGKPERQQSGKNGG